MLNYPLISVIIPNYNYARYLSVAISSVLSQTYPNIEIIVVNNGSTDNSIQVLRQFGSQIILLDQQNLGQSGARNSGLRAAQGDLIAFLDADDFWRNQWPRGARRPSLYYDPRGLAIEPTQRASMHAKVVVIDRRKAFVTSANLTARAQQENIELGVLVSHAPTAERIVAYFQALMTHGHLIQVHGNGDRK